MSFEPVKTIKTDAEVAHLFQRQGEVSFLESRNGDALFRTTVSSQAWVINLEKRSSLDGRGYVAITIDNLQDCELTVMDAQLLAHAIENTKEIARRKGWAV
jgi:aspartyl/asparaginyl-tRNA synthetase